MVSKMNKGLQSCSTPEHRAESPTRDSDSLSEAASPVPFLCTQDGAEGENDVVWNFYTPKSGRTANTVKNSTPLSRKSKRTLRSKLIDKPLPKRRNLRSTQKNTQLFQDLIELNQNLHELFPKKAQHTEKQHSGSEDDIFGISPECSPKGTRRLSSNNCLRKNVLSSNFNKPETENVLDSDDSMNECLIKASQIVEDIIMDEKPVSKRPYYEKHNTSNLIHNNSNTKLKINHDSMDIILGNIKLESPRIKKVKKSDSPHLKDDSFDSMFGNLNDSVFEQLTQMPVKLDVSKKTDLKAVDGSPMSKSFGRHNSMPESPLMMDNNKPSTSGMVFGRYNTMPHYNG
ncbi:hypothetical protein O3G_MSEX013844 [Manduca sexta]|uniref:Uncharacterized protein n=1 Tax=Manduca sexta TaxID=7130 RepID=A0A921ZTW5_MANSE|nr:hypothetical protein O3G_MSEX013844 [Manduca sexta]